MRRRRIRYKRIFFCLGILIALIAGIYWQVAGWKTDEHKETEYFLFLGVGPEPADEADSIWLMAFNKELNEIHVISIPGNTRVSDVNEPLILLRSEYKEGKVEKTISSVENLLHIRVTHYAVFDETSFTEMLKHGNEMTFYVEKDMKHTDRNGNSDINLRKGVQNLDEISSYGYMRFIENPEDEIGRIRRNQRFLKMLVSTQKDNFPFQNRLMVQRYWAPAITDISGSEAGALAYAVSEIPIDNIHFMILPGKAKMLDNIRVWDINPVELQSAIGAVLGQSTEVAK